VQVDIKWEASSRSHSGASFLDLPMELRDIIYQNICDDLKREGIVWEKFALEVRVNEYGEVHLLGREMQRRCPEVFSNCAIMRTCRQMHSEFAECMYAIPMQMAFNSIGLHMLPFSPIYIPLVRSVVAIYTECEHCWSLRLSTALKIANALTRTFPNLDTQRVGWWGHMDVPGEKWTHMDVPGEKWTHMDVPEEKWTHLEQSNWDAAVRDAMKHVEIVNQLMDPPLNIPHNMELVQLLDLAYWADLLGIRDDIQGELTPLVVSLVSPLADAIQRMRETKRGNYEKDQRIVVE
jgi:hypothetical protein